MLALETSYITAHVNLPMVTNWVRDTRPHTVLCSHLSSEWKALDEVGLLKLSRCASSHDLDGNSMFSTLYSRDKRDRNEINLSALQETQAFLSFVQHHQCA